MLLRRTHAEEICAHARAALPEECCGLIGGIGAREHKHAARESSSVYRLRNTASNPQMRYAAAPQDLFAAQKQMRLRGEELIGIYHSHPRDHDPVPSRTDVRLAYYPDVIYFIVGFVGRRAVLRAFRIYADEERWEPAPHQVE